MYAISANNLSGDFDAASSLLPFHASRGDHFLLSPPGNVDDATAMQHEVRIRETSNERK